MKTFFAVMFAAFLGCGAVVVGVWSGDRQPPTETISTRIEPSVIAAGGAGDVQYVYQRYRACDRRSKASVIDSAGRKFEFAAQTSPPTLGRVPGEPNSYVRPFRVPSSAKPGPAIYHVELEDSCNPLQAIWRPIRRTIEVPFEIAPAEPVPGPAAYRSGEGLTQYLMRRFAAAGR